MTHNGGCYIHYILYIVVYLCYIYELNIFFIDSPKSKTFSVHELSAQIISEDLYFHELMDEDSYNSFKLKHTKNWRKKRMR